MKELVVKNIAKEKIDLDPAMIGVNVIEATIGDATFHLPHVAASKSDIDKAEKTSIPITTELIQYFHQVQNRFPLTDKHYSQKITKTFRHLMEKYPNHISDINFDFLKNRTITPQEIESVLQIQRDVKSPFLSIIESNKEQSLGAFIAELDNTSNPHKQILCPGIDLDTVTPDLFSKKLDYILEKKYPRFNVKYASLQTRYSNWLDLSEKIFGKDVWCNVTSVPRGYFNTTPPHRSLLACIFLYGVHTASHGYGRFSQTSIDKKNTEAKKPEDYTRRLLDPNSFYYDETNTAYDQSIVNSLNNLCSEMNKIRSHVLNDTFVTKYLPTRGGFIDELNDLKRRM